MALIIQELKRLERKFGLGVEANRLDPLPGTGPLVVEREAGAVHFLSNSAPPGNVVEEFERRWKLVRPAR